ncbi:glycosyltransferase family 9 protein [hot springs metagenome]|uniref:Glycosyltransferase family 9 protein n=1 Tax=hot springs metagenome TaxID=433727 RepID=A0A5J4L5T8_9ZZZZ
MRLHPADTILYLTMRILKFFDKRQTDIKYFNPDEVKNILVVSSTAIGDTLLSTPAIKAVRERYPNAKIIAHFNVKNMELFENNPHIDGIIPYYGGYKKFFKTIREFRKHKFDLALIFHGNEPQATPMAYLSGARFIVKLPNTNEYRFLLSNKNSVLRWEDFTHGVEQRLRVAEIAGCKISDKRMTLPLSEEGDAMVDKFLKENSVTEKDILIGFQVGASTISRMWFPDRFVELGKKLIDSNSAVKIVITGSPQEYNYCKGIADDIGEKAFVSAGKIPLKYMPSLIRRFRVLVSGDTGIMHMAIAVGTPVVALFAVANAKRSGPYYDMERHVVIQKERTCSPCDGKACRYQRCMESISVEEADKSLKKYLGLG